VSEPSDRALDRLRQVAQWPDLTGTRYELQGEVARGGMGVVYLARDRELERDVALKVIAVEAADSETAERLRREARTIARLEHPGIVPVHDVGVLPDGRVFYAMKLVTGKRLDELVKAGLPLRDRLRLLLRIGEPVAFAHAHGVIHRDLKPENVMVGPFGEVLVMDWGVAKHRGDVGAVSGSPAPRAEGATAHGTIVGTPAYMAPEQLRGDPPDARTDVFSLGVIAYEMLVGDLPFGGGSVGEVVLAQTRGLPSAGIETLPAPLSRAVQEALALDADRRPPSPQALAYLIGAATGAL
jgi:eukaryotic-like serine/threonine-protein kinase